MGFPSSRLRPGPHVPLRATRRSTATTSRRRPEPGRSPPTDCPSSGAVCCHGADDHAVIGSRALRRLRSGFATAAPRRGWALYQHGLWYSAAVLGILGAHEMGHYLACRYYRVDASLPYFLPAPLLLTGTLGAFIRIRQPIPNKRELFDIGIAGPIAGFLVAIPVLFIGISLSTMFRMPTTGGVVDLGRAAAAQGACIWLVWGTRHDGYTSTSIRSAFAAWFGLAGDAAQPVSLRAARWRAHLLRRARPAQHARQLRHDPLLPRPVVFVASSWIVWTGADAGDAVLLRPAPSAHLRRGHAARYRPAVAGGVCGRDVRASASRRCRSSTWSSARRSRDGRSEPTRDGRPARPT